MRKSSDQWKKQPMNKEGGEEKDVRRWGFYVLLEQLEYGASNDIAKKDINHHKYIVFDCTISVNC
jgi:hypothetical protein